MFLPATALAVSIPNWIQNYWIWWVAAVIVVGGLLVFGLDELRRLAFRRVWAISSVCFAESIRRKVLWVIPLAILGVIAVSLLQHATDPQEAIRQVIKFSLFASGLMVTVTAVILACTNLPREIENRVIFTIVTKPTTRLEIVLGKVLGFIRVSGLIVLIMGTFTFAYLGVENSRLSAQIAERLKTEKDPSTRVMLEGYQTAGLLGTKSLETPVDFQIWEHDATPEETHWITGGYGFTFLVPFNLTEQNKAALEAAGSDPEHKSVMIIDTMRLSRHKPTSTEEQWIVGKKLALENQGIGPMPGGQSISPIPIPQLTLRVLDPSMNVVLAEKDINGGNMATAQAGIPLDSTKPYTITAGLSTEAVRTLIQAGKFYIQVIPETFSVEYEIAPTPTVLDIFDANTKSEQVVKASDPPRFISSSGRYGMKIIGKSDGTGSIGFFRFTGADTPADQSKPVVFRFRAGIERTGEYDASKPWSLVTLTVRNRETGKRSPPVECHPETNQDIPVAVPAEFVRGGNFDVLVRGMDNGQFVGLANNSVQLISAEHSFVVNLLASLLLLWLLSILVVTIAIFTSTFLSWPIAIVLTLLLLLGHWGVEQLGDTLNPGVGRGVAAEFGVSDKTQNQLISSSVDALAKLLTTVSAVLPDLSKFPVMENITRGVATPPRQVAEALGVLVCYALPLLVISFIILKNKEVAP
jgi:ABC-type transport system involved in multi-copper enzyme maturation permease subunit